MARATGLEPATTGSTVRNSIQLSYAPASRRPAVRRCAERKCPADERPIVRPRGGVSSENAPQSAMRRGNDFWQGTISCGLAVAPGFIPGVIPGASWPAPPPTAAGHKARRYNRLRPPEKLAPIGDGGALGPRGGAAGVPAGDVTADRLEVGDMRRSWPERPWRWSSSLRLRRRSRRRTATCRPSAGP